MVALPGRPAGLNNTAFLFALIAAAWLFYITIRGDLGKWIGLILPGNTASQNATGGQGRAPAPVSGLPDV